MATTKGMEEKAGTRQMKHNVIIHFDGGCSPNPGAKYGSYSLVFDDLFQLQVNRRKFGHGTNNEAEFEALIGALELLKSSCVKASVELNQIALEIFTDSTIVFNWIRKFHTFNPSKHPEERRMAMYERAKKCMAILMQIHSHEISWNPRDVNVEKFGH